MYTYHAIIDDLSAHMILNTIFYTHVKHSLTNAVYIKYYNLYETKQNKNTQCIQFEEQKYMQILPIKGRLQ